MPRVSCLIVRWCTRRSIRASSSPIGLAFKVDAVARSAVLLVENEALGWLLLGSAGAHEQQTRANGRAQHRNDNDSHYEPRRSYSHGRLALVLLRDSISSTVGGGQPDRRRSEFPEAGDAAVLVWRSARPFHDIAKTEVVKRDLVARREILRHAQPGRRISPGESRLSPD